MPLSGLDQRSGPLFRTVAASPALVARARAIAADLERILADELEHEHAGGTAGPGALLVPFFIAGYTHVLVTSARRLLADEPASSIANEHHARLDDLFAALARESRLHRDEWRRSQRRAAPATFREKGSFASLQSCTEGDVL